MDDVKFLSPDLYPKKLYALKTPPRSLYIQGSLPSPDAPTLGIVGTRSATPYGKKIAFEWAKELAALGVVIISGLARGIDTEAHQGALLTGQTIAFIGSGHKQLYPKENAPLALQIAKQGAVLSEYEPQTPPTRYSFPERNRLIAALSDAVLLIEAPQKSGAMITMRQAQILKKPLFAIPARVDMPSFEGNFFLLKEKIAAMATSFRDLLSSLNIEKAHSRNNFIQERKEASDDSLCLYIQEGSEISLEELVVKTALPVAKLNVLLMKLEIQGKIRQLPGKLYTRV